MHRYAQDLSTILGLAVLLGSVIAVLIGRMDAETLFAIVPSCAIAIGVPQRNAPTTVRAETAIVAPTTINAASVPVVRTDAP